MPFATGLHYTFHNPGKTSTSRPPLILLHGAGGSLLSWHPYIRRLANTTVYALDLPGHGKSAGQPRQSIEEIARDVSAFLEALRIETVVIAGLSMGSGIALTLGLKYAHKVVGLALLGGGSKLRVANSILENAGNPSTFESAVDLINANCFSAYAAPDMVALSKQNMLSMSPAGLLADFTACNQFDVTDQLSRIQVPTLILCGAEDRMTPLKLSQTLKDRIPNSELHILEKTGHMLTLEQPETIASLLGDFLDTIPLHPRPAA
ncbi:MAG TPA: alpha/beta hydrolase [Anaerolineales bacterium]|nr:alpha/beta hydrolase [Anaerolineales bacterium]